MASGLHNIETGRQRYFAIRCRIAATANWTFAIRSGTTIFERYGLLHAESAKAMQSSLCGHWGATGLANNVRYGALGAGSNWGWRTGRCAESDALVLGSYFFAGGLFRDVSNCHLSKYRRVVACEGKQIHFCFVHTTSFLDWFRLVSPTRLTTRSWLSDVDAVAICFRKHSSEFG